MIGLTWRDIDLAERTVSVRWIRVEGRGGTYLVEPKSPASRRTLALPNFVATALERQLEREQKKATAIGAKVLPEDPVLTTRNRRPYWTSYLHHELKRRLQRLGLPPMRYHDLRHTAASLMFREGVPPRVVMEIMGHKNLDVTMLIYGHVCLDQQRKAAELVDNALS